MTGTRQVSWPRRRIDRYLNRVCAIVSRDPGCDALPRINRFAKSRSILRSVLGSHASNAQMIQPLLGHRQANQSPPIFGHKVDGLGRNLFSGQREITFVLAVFIVHHDNHPPSTYLFDRSGNIGKWGCRRHKIRILAPEIGQHRQPQQHHQPPSNAQPRSGARIQPTAQAVGTKSRTYQAPKGRKNAGGFVSDD